MVKVLVELVITRDSGEIETFNAYRVQHDNRCFGSCCLYISAFFSQCCDYASPVGAAISEAASRAGSAHHPFFNLFNASGQRLTQSWCCAMQPGAV